MRLLTVSAWLESAAVLRTQADPLYLFCTCTRAFCRFLLIELFEFSNSFENSPIVADRLPPPPPPKSHCFNQIQMPLLALYLFLVVSPLTSQ
jgi:hypothetical protein